MDAEPAAAAAADPIAAAKAEAEEAVALYQSVCGNLVTFRENALLCVARHAALAGVPATTVIYPVPPELDVSDGIEVILQDAKARGAALRNARESTRAALGAEYARESVMLAMRATLELSLRDGNVEAIKVALAYGYGKPSTTLILELPEVADDALILEVKRRGELARRRQSGLGPSALDS